MMSRFILPIILAALTFSAFPQEAEFRVMTLNIRYDNQSDGINRWDRRKHLVARTLKKEQPDIIGLQEVLENQLQFLDHHMKKYSSVGVGRDDGREAGEYSPILFIKGRFSLVRWGAFWLSETPSDTGSVGWDAALPRICTWAILRDSALHGEIFVLNTHFDHIGEQARTESARLIERFILKNFEGRPVILTGDFNCTPYQEAYRVLTDPDFGLRDACVEANGLKGCHDGTFNGFGKTDIKERIDLILLKGPWDIKSSQVLKIRKNKIYISDHYPVEAVAKLKTKN